MLSRGRLSSSLCAIPAILDLLSERRGALRLHLLQPWRPKSASGRPLPQIPNLPITLYPKVRSRQSRSLTMCSPGNSRLPRYASRLRTEIIIPDPHLVSMSSFRRSILP